ncbi:Galactose oxidase, central domain [Rhizobium sp. RU20A]|uniref:AbfB domain-containing protein n=1 Tax=Rhizobium sp. RU20A TaxID=1907412 RepID=UPI00095500C5|nr:AbfB domain-containing protein [Rhizobium sp. RU20A]SIQ86459.1 Galactose oxidase, central domain [Rhizobium sp. RU20A]
MSIPIASIRPFVASAALLLPLAGVAQAGTVSEVINWGSIPIHAALTPDGRIMTFGSTPQDGQGGFDYVLWDPAKGNGPESRIQLPNGVNFNSFCVGGVIDPATGRLILAGGAGKASDAAVYDYASTRMTTSPALKYPRYYGTLTTLPDGRVLVDGGSPAYGNQTNSSPIAEIYNPVSGSWTTLPGTAGSPQRQGDIVATGNPFWYPHEYPIGNNSVFALAGKYSYILNYSGNGSFSDVATTTRNNWGASSTSVMFRPGLLMQLGGGTPGNDLDNNPGSNLATTYDLRAKNRDFSRPITATDTTMRLKRHFATATVLANGEVAVTGGSEGNNTLLNVANRIEIYNPDTNQWRLDAALTRPRLYHSMALLLKDGRVLTGGGGAPGPVAGHDIEIFTPDYLLDSSGKPAVRPSITDGPRAALALGQTFRITADTPITRVTIVKSGVATHSYNTDQRFFEAQFSASGNNADVIFPNDAINATPGLYMVFAFNADGVPSVGKLVRLKSPTGDTGFAVPNDMPTPKTPTGTPVPASGWAFCGNENDKCPVNGTQQVRYGANGTYVTRTVTDIVTCNNGTFGDPLPGVVKRCEIQANTYGKFTTAGSGSAGEGSGGSTGTGNSSAVGTDWTFCANENQQCQVNGTQTVRYGANGTFVTRSVTNSVACNNATFGDPVYGVVKRCEVAASATSNTPVGALTIGSVTAFEPVTWQGYLIRHANFLGYMSKIGQGSSAVDKADSTFTVRAGLSNNACYSLESKNYPGYYLRHENFRIKLAKNDNSQTFRTTATFCARPALSGQGGAVSLESVDWPGYFIRHQNFALSIMKDDGSTYAKTDTSFKTMTPYK